MAESTAKQALATPPAQPAWWVRLAAALPLSVLYGVAGACAALAYRIGYQRPILEENLRIAFPQLDTAGIDAIRRAYYRGFAQVLAEVVKAVRLPGQELRRRVRIQGLEAVRAELTGGKPVILVAAHQCNWEWMLLALSLALGFPLDAAYKPLVDSWAEREMLKLRTRFGSRLVPAQELLADIIKRGRTPRAICMVADQEPRTSEHQHWTRFLNRDTAFYMGAEEIARVTRFSVYFVAMRRTARGHYDISVEPLAPAGEKREPGELTERYARRVERQIREAPADWPWSHKRWKLKKSLYGRS